jgi:Flp pilus assembly pilin Flp
MTKLTGSNRFWRDSRGATVVEYSLVLLTVVVTAAPLIGTLGKRVNASFGAAIAQFGP